jgi:hypothetical protein
MIRCYEVERNVDILGPVRITIAKGRYETSDEFIQSRISKYPGVRLVASRADEPIGIGDNPFPPAPGDPIVTSVVGLQMKEKKNCLTETK